MSSKTIAFICHLSYKFPQLLSILEEHIEDNSGEILPHLLMYEYTNLLTGSSSKEKWVSDFLTYIEEVYTPLDDEISNLIAVSLIENLPFEVGKTHWVVNLLGDKMKEYYHEVYE